MSKAAIIKSVQLDLEATEELLHAKPSLLTVTSNQVLGHAGTKTQSAAKRRDEADEGRLEANGSWWQARTSEIKEGRVPRTLIASVTRH